MESNRFSSHSTEMLLSLDFNRKSTLLLLPFYFNIFKVILNLLCFGNVRSKYLYSFTISSFNIFL